jgi:polyferredoxin
MEKLATTNKVESPEEFQTAWNEVVRDFHKNQWGQQRLLKKEKKPKTEEQKIFWELFSYIWILVQAMLIVKTVVFYLGIKSANEDTAEGKIYVISAILFSFTSLIFFAYRKSKKENKEK